MLTILLLAFLACLSRSLATVVHCGKYGDTVIDLHNTKCVDGSTPWIDRCQICCPLDSASAFCCEMSNPFKCFVKRLLRQSEYPMVPPQSTSHSQGSTIKEQALQEEDKNEVDDLDFYSCQNGYFSSDTKVGDEWCCPTILGIGMDLCCTIKPDGPSECYIKRLRAKERDMAAQVPQPQCNCQNNNADDPITTTARPKTKSKSSSKDNFRAMGSASGNKIVPQPTISDSDSSSAEEEASTEEVPKSVQKEITDDDDLVTEHTTLVPSTEIPDNKDLAFEVCKAKGLASFYMDNDTVCCVGNVASQCCLEDRPIACSTDEFTTHYNSIDGFGTGVLEYKDFEKNCTFESGKKNSSLTANLTLRHVTRRQRFLSPKVTFEQVDECDVRVLMNVSVDDLPVGFDYAIELGNKITCGGPNDSSVLLTTFPMNLRPKVLLIPTPVFSMEKLRGKPLSVTRIDANGSSTVLACGHLQ